MDLEGENPAVQLALRRLGLSQRECCEPKQEDFSDYPSPALAYAEQLRIYRNNRYQVENEIKKMRDYGVSEAEYESSGSPWGFPFKVIRCGEYAKPAKLISPADSRTNIVEQYTLQMMGKRQQKLRFRQQRALRQEQRNEHFMEQIHEQQEQCGQLVRQTVHKANNQARLREAMLDEKISDKMRRADSNIMQIEQEKEREFDLESEALASRIQKAQNVARGESKEQLEVKKQELLKTEEQIERKEAKHEFQIQRIQNAISENINEINRRTMSAAQLKEEKHQELVQKVQNNEQLHDSIVSTMKMREKEENERIRAEMREKEEYERQAVRSALALPKQIAGFEETLLSTKEEIAQENHIKSMEQQWEKVELSNQFELQQAETMKKRIAAKIAYKKAVYDNGQGNAPFVM